MVGGGEGGACRTWWVGGRGCPRACRSVVGFLHMVFIIIR